jgi:alkylated DNA repair dioxygenase AlkB
MFSLDATGENGRTASPALSPDTCPAQPLPHLSDMRSLSSRKRPASSFAQQADLFGAPRGGLEGFRYQPDLLTADEEADLVRHLGDLPFKAFDSHGHLANRRVVGFGLRYDYERRQVVEAPAIPDFLAPLQAKAAAFAGRPAAAFAQVLINEYRPGAGIGWHCDKPHFDEVVGVSLLAACDFRFRRKAGSGWDRETARLARRSAYLLSGPARNVWEHSIAPLEEHRYSITLRTLAPP